MTILAILVLVAVMCVAITIMSIPGICKGEVDWWLPSAVVAITLSIVAALAATVYGLITATMWAIGVLCGGAS